MLVAKTANHRLLWLPRLCPAAAEPRLWPSQTLQNYRERAPRVVLRIAAADGVDFNCGLQLDHRASTGSFSKEASAVPAPSKEPQRVRKQRRVAQEAADTACAFFTPFTHACAHPHRAVRWPCGNPAKAHSWLFWQCAQERVEIVWSKEAIVLLRILCINEQRYCPSSLCWVRVWHWLQCDLSLI